MNRVIAALVLIPCLVVVGGCGVTVTKKVVTAPKGGGNGNEWTLNPENTKIEFVGTKPEGKHDGGFKDFSGTVVLAEDPANSKVEVEIKAESLYSDNPKLTSHLKSPDFFDVKNNSTAKFVSTKIAEDKGEGKTHSITGDLTLLGKSKSISFPAEVSESDGKLTLKSSFTINRTDFGMTYGKGKIDDDVKISVTVNATK